MVKAGSYGAGDFEVAQMLQHQGVDYLAVAFADEGVLLRERGFRCRSWCSTPMLTASTS